MPQRSFEKLFVIGKGFVFQASLNSDQRPKTFEKP